MKTGDLATSFIGRLFHPRGLSQVSTGCSLDHATIGKSVTSPFAWCGGACLQGPSSVSLPPWADSAFALTLVEKGFLQLNTGPQLNKKGKYPADVHLNEC